jgi:hypothetical protein
MGDAATASCRGITGPPAKHCPAINHSITKVCTHKEHTAVSPLHTRTPGGTSHRGRASRLETLTRWTAATGLPGSGRRLRLQAVHPPTHPSPALRTIIQRKSWVRELVVGYNKVGKAWCPTSLQFTPPAGNARVHTHTHTTTAADPSKAWHTRTRGSSHRHTHRSGRAARGGRMHG